ncbi:MAG: ABC transporter substrate-binding protein, partial [Okeania sp. SIO2C9]|uniref:ABC transporter substrate-binding protein n=1 Tax=Okeania sp. SIO2C9 TaxID=2607791 RepID=UPI0013C129FA
SVLDLGSMLGWDTLRNDIRNIGIVLQEQERAEQLLLQIKRRLEHAAIHVPAAERKTAMWLAVYGGKLAGGTVGSSRHHLLRFAGLRDIVAGTVDFGWPSYSVEEVLAYDPDYIVTGGGMSGGSMAEDIRAMPGLNQLRAVRENNIITMPKGTDDTGPGLVEAVEFLCDAVYGPPPAIERALLPEEEKN